MPESLKNWLSFPKGGDLEAALTFLDAFSKRGLVAASVNVFL